jgi:hypothetical protein
MVHRQVSQYPTVCFADPDLEIVTNRAYRACDGSGFPVSVILRCPYFREVSISYVVSVTLVTAGGHRCYRDSGSVHYLG